MSLLLRWLRFLRGLWRLRQGWCPECSSSPPRLLCPVCEGSFLYGPRISDDLRLQWLRRWEAMA